MSSEAQMPIPTRGLRLRGRNRKAWVSASAPVRSDDAPLVTLRATHASAGVDLEEQGLWNVSVVGMAVERPGCAVWVLTHPDQAETPVACFLAPADADRWLLTTSARHALAGAPQPQRGPWTPAATVVVVVGVVAAIGLAALTVLYGGDIAVNPM